MEVALYRHWEVFAELRWVFLETDVRVNTGRTGESELATTRGDVPYDHGVLRLGLNYRF